ncbi:helix-turn-helix domain-containing protein [Chitinophaga cymbidii]|uniref:Transcriptional regulator n=1 Tax=Chitinophaga cymbidii TaxID=1096750 RepID=A0A512RFQ3_9BACT|nr:helix-turn-helix domain-containing protein [Chitinophaga cymbidii]GEP94539.1 transcriptional regulator [Chitinophaga cymbidii]
MSKVRVLERSGFRPADLQRLVTLDDLQEFKKELLVAMQAMFSRHVETSPKKWLKTYEVKKILNISSGTLQTLRSNGTIPFSRIGGIIYYNAEDVDAALEAQKRDYSKLFKTK